ncbi:MAG: clan AA aspartic protease [Flavobacterium sp.]|nr:clan AA aspartic protease [Candidatus Neoflavobacterium equi]
MEGLPEFFKSKGYKKIPFKIAKTKHLIIKAKINGIGGRFILDTGASNSCVGFEEEFYFNLISSHSDTTAAGAGAVGMETRISYNNSLKLSNWTQRDFNIIVFDLQHVNLALENHQVERVHGILGADVLIESAAIVDYENKYLYLKDGKKA